MEQINVLPEPFMTERTVIEKIVAIIVPDEGPVCPQEVLFQHSELDFHQFVIGYGALEVLLQQLVDGKSGKPGFQYVAGNVPVQAVHAGVFPVNEIGFSCGHADEKIFRDRVVMTGDEEGIRIIHILPDTELFFDVPVIRK